MSAPGSAVSSAAATSTESKPIIILVVGETMLNGAGNMRALYEDKIAPLKNKYDIVTYTDADKAIEAVRALPDADKERVKALMATHHQEFDDHPEFGDSTAAFLDAKYGYLDSPATFGGGDCVMEHVKDFLPKSTLLVLTGIVDAPLTRRGNAYQPYPYISLDVRTDPKKSSVDEQLAELIAIKDAATMGRN